MKTILLGELLNKNTSLRKSLGSFTKVLYDVEKSIPFNLKYNFYNNLSTLKIELNLDKTKILKNFYSFGIYDAKENKIIIDSYAIKKFIKKNNINVIYFNKYINLFLYHELMHMAEKNARLVSVEDRPVESGDITVIDFEGFVDGVAFDGGKAENHELTIGSNTFIPGFEDQIIGMKPEEEKEIKVKFPEEYFSANLAGKDATFKVKLHEIKKKEMPEINDELAKDISEFDTIEELKNSIKEKQEEQNKSKAKYETEDEVIKAVCAEAKVEIPSGMIETETDHMVQDINTRLSYQGMNIDQYLKMMNKTMEEFRAEYKEQAETAVKSRLVLEAVGKDAGIEVKEEEISAKIKEMAENYGRKEEEVKDNPELVKYVGDSLKTEKTIDFLVENAKIK